MLPGERFKKWIDDFAMSIKDRLRGWMASWLAFGIEVFFDVLGKAFAPKLKPMVESLEATGEVPAEIQPLLDELKSPTGEAGAALGSMLGYSLIGGALGRMTEALFGVMGQEMSKLRPTLIPSPPQFFDLLLRGEISPEDFKEGMLRNGWDENWQALLYKLAHPIPPLADMVRFADFGSFDPTVIELWREFYDAPDWIKAPMALLGITPEWADKYWFSHWRQPGRFELGELHRRGEIDDAIVKNAYLTQGFSSFWQDKLLELVKETWTRVDIRRMWDMGTISEDEMRKAYQAQGYYDEWLEGMVLWTKVYVAFPDLMARWTKGWITIDDVRRELTALGMPAERVEEMIQTKIKPQEPERVEDEKSLTKTEIYKGVKKEIITWGEGVELLMDLGYGYDEADYILTINVETLAGSPETFEEFKCITQKYKLASGREAKPMPEELKKAAEEVIRLTGEVEALERSIEEEERALIDVEVLPEETTRRLKKLQVTKNRAISELERVKSDYNSQLAEWRHG